MKNKVALSLIVSVPVIFLSVEYYAIHFLLNNEFSNISVFAELFIKISISLISQILFFLGFIKINSKKLNIIKSIIQNSNIFLNIYSFIFPLVFGFVMSSVIIVAVFYISNSIIVTHPLNNIDFMFFLGVISMQVLLVANVVLKWELEKPKNKKL